MNTKYEMTVILEKEELLKDTKKILEEVGATVEKEESWGKRDLAYPINKLTSAFYVTLYFTVEKEKLAELKKKLNFTDTMMRYLLLKVEE